MRTRAVSMFFLRACRYIWLIKELRVFKMNCKFRRTDPFRMMVRISCF